jgi:acyl-CoA synthetase (AMP-forming)/AMP-acid ligase II
MIVVQAFGVPDPRMGEELCACIRHRKGAVLSEEELRAFCRGKVCVHILHRGLLVLWQHKAVYLQLRQSVQYGPWISKIILKQYCGRKFVLKP